MTGEKANRSALFVNALKEEQEENNFNHERETPAIATSAGGKREEKERPW